MLLEIKCPNCRTRVWVSENGQCPSCRKQAPERVLQQAVADVEQGSSPIVESTNRTIVQSDVPTSNESSSYSPSASNFTEQTETKIRTVRRIHTGKLFSGLFLALMGGLMFLMSTSEHEIHSTSRRVRAMQQTIGTQATDLLAGVLFVGIGSWLIFTCRFEVIEEEALHAESHKCAMCNSTTSDTAVAFVTIGGRPIPILYTIRQLFMTDTTLRPSHGPNPFPDAFRCHACNECLQKSSRLFWAHVLQSILLILSVIVIPFALLGLIVAASQGTDLKPTAGIFMAIFEGIALLLVVSVGLLYRYVSRGTGRLLGIRLDPMIRQVVRIKRWGWPRCVMLSRSIPSSTLVINTVEQ